MTGYKSDIFVHVFTYQWSILLKVPVKSVIYSNYPSVMASLCPYSKICVQGTLWWEDALWSGDIFSERCPIFPMLRNLWRRGTCRVGTLSLAYRGVPWRQVLLYSSLSECPSYCPVPQLAVSRKCARVVPDFQGHKINLGDSQIKIQCVCNIFISVQYCCYYVRYKLILYYGPRVWSVLEYYPMQELYVAT